MSNGTWNPLDRLSVSITRPRQKFYIERSISLRPGSGTGARHLIEQYGQSYTGRDDLAVTATGQREFAIIIPDDWNNE
jgi:hypothetical protein